LKRAQSNSKSLKVRTFFVNHFYLNAFEYVSDFDGLASRYFTRIVIVLAISHHRLSNTTMKCAKKRAQ